MTVVLAFLDALSSWLLQKVRVGNSDIQIMTHTHTHSLSNTFVTHCYLNMFTVCFYMLCYI